MAIEKINVVSFFLLDIVSFFISLNTVLKTALLNFVEYHSSPVSNLIPTTESRYCREFGILSCFKAASSEFELMNIMIATLHCP